MEINIMPWHAIIWDGTNEDEVIKRVGAEYWTRLDFSLYDGSDRTLTVWKNKQHVILNVGDAVYVNADGNIEKKVYSKKEDKKPEPEDLVKEEDFARFVGCCVMDAEDEGINLSVQQIRIVYDNLNYIYNQKK
jgi:hypothetical protein